MLKSFIHGHDQTTDFTCGAASLLTAMKIFGYENIDSTEEYLIWREANSVFMGEGQAGIGPYALACAAKRRGMSAEIWTDTTENQFCNDLDPGKRDVYRLMERYDREQCDHHGITIHKSDFKVNDLLENTHENKVLIFLIAPENEDHWVLSYKMANGGYFYFDPYYKAVEEYIDESDFPKAFPSASIKVGVILGV